MAASKTTPLVPEQGHEFFVKLIAGYRSAKIVFSANELGIFGALAEGPRTAVELAAQLKYAQHPTEVLLKALVALGVLVVEAGRFSNGPLAAECLVPGKPRFVGNNLAFQELIWPCWSALSDVVRTGSPKAQLMDLLESKDSTFTREYIRGMDNIARQPAAEVAKILTSRKVEKMLDVGGGPGTFSRAVLDLAPTATATIFDLAGTLEVARALTPPPLRDRLQLQTGNYLKDDFGSGYDVALLSHVTHDEDPATTLALLRKAYAALRPAGRVAIHDFVVADDGCSPPFSALFSVNMLVYTKGGRTYSSEQYRALLLEAGFQNVEAHPILESQVGNPTRLLVAEKRAE